VQLLKYMNYRVQTAMSQGRMPGPEAATTKLFISQHQTLTGELLLSMLGAGGMLDKSDALDGGKWQLAFLNQFSVKIGGGTDNIQRNALGERVLGLPAEPRTDKNVPFKDLAAGTSG
jgi:alkylation response protein AidB-like acyl-CoA dehydrogenase